MSEVSRSPVFVPMRAASSRRYFDAMPTVLRVGPYRFFFYSTDRDEPPHVHVESAGRLVKFWLSPVSVAQIGGIKRAELRQIRRLVERRRGTLLKAWNDFFR